MFTYLCLQIEMSKLPDIRSGAQIMMTCTQQERLDLTKTCPSSSC